MTRPVQVVIEAARIAEMDDLDDECILERSRVVSIVPARMPFVGLKGRYNKRWYVDIITLPHNAIRRHMSDVFSSLTFMNKMALDLTEPDFQVFYRYLGIVSDFIQAVLEGEEHALYPHLHGESSLRNKLRGNEITTRLVEAEYRASVKKEIVKLLKESMKDRYAVLPSITTLDKIQSCLDSFGKAILDYFKEKEGNFPQMLSKSVRGSKEKTKYESRLINFLLTKQNGSRFVAMLAKPLVSPGVRAEFIERHFDKEGQKISFEKSVKEFAEEIQIIPDAIEQAGLAYERKFSMGAFIEHYGQDRDPDATTELI